MYNDDDVVFSLNMSVMQSNKKSVFFLYVFEKVSISETHRIPGGLPSVAVCVQPSVFQLSHTHSALECVSAAPAGLHVCQHRAHKSFGRTGVQFNIEINTCQQILSTYV